MPLSPPVAPVGINAPTLRGAWAASTLYTQNDMATSGGELYQALLTHTSGGSFVVGSNWVKLVAKGDTGATGPAGGTQLYGAEVTATQTFSGASYAALTTPVGIALPAVPAVTGMTASLMGFLVTGELSAGDTTDTPGIGVYDSDGDIGTAGSPLIIFNTKSNLGSGVFRQFGSIPSTSNSGAVFTSVTHIPTGLIHHWATTKGTARTYSLAAKGGGTTTTFSVKNLRLWVLTYA